MDKSLTFIQVVVQHGTVDSGFDGSGSGVRDGLDGGGGWGGGRAGHAGGHQIFPHSQLQVAPAHGVAGRLSRVRGRGRPALPGRLRCGGWLGGRAGPALPALSIVAVGVAVAIIHSIVK